MDLHQKDFLTEVLNIGLGRASAALSEMSGSHVNLNVPDLTICRAEELPSKLTLFGDEAVLAVRQEFSGILSGDAILVLSKFSGQILTHRLFQELLEPDNLEEQIESAVTELGNIIINHFVGSWSEIFYDRFRFGVPSYNLGALAPLLAERRGQRQGMYAIYAEAHLDIPEFFVMASLITLFEQSSLEKLVGAVTETG